MAAQKAAAGPDIARRTAVLGIVRLHRGGWANLTLKGLLAGGALTPQQKAFAAALFYGTAERLATLDYLLAPHLKQPPEKLDAEVRALLETGLYQVLYMDVPPHAAVNQAVKLARALKKSSAAGLVNAVLRRALEKPNLPETFASEEQRVCVTYSVSPAVARAVMAALPGEYNAFLQASFMERPLCIRVNTLRTTPAALADALRQKGAKVTPGRLANCLYVQLPGGVAEEEFFLKGHYHVQGEASQFACHVLAVKPGEKVLDLCAAPGGKSAALAQALSGGGGLTACELRENRLPLIKETFTRLGIAGAEILQNDASVYSEKFAGQDKVLCDVPCSGLGTLAANPDLRYTAGGQFAPLPKLQGDILSTAARYVKKGGRLVYSTCTIRREENADVVRAFLAENSSFKPVLPDFAGLCPRLDDTFATFLPDGSIFDGFFVATLERVW